MCRRAIFPHQIDLVLEDDDVVELHDFDGCKMLTRLRLWAGFVSGNEKQGSIHDSGSGQHSAHENIVTRTVHERDVSLQPICAFASFPLARWIDLLLALVGSVARRPGAVRIIALVYFRIGITQLDCDIPLQLVLESHGLDPRNGLYYRTLSVGDVTDCSDVDCSLPRDDLRR